MKLEHDVVQDLYPLYLEDDLSPSVKTSVDEHLKECEECNTFYETGEKSFQINEIEEPIVPQSLDEKIILKMKLNRLRLISVVLATIIFSMVFTDYINEREKLFMAIDEYYASIDHFTDAFEMVKNKKQITLDPFQQLSHAFFEANAELEEYMNFVEKNNKNSAEFSLILDTQRLNSMVEVMKIRYDQGRWSETDEEAFRAIKEHFKEHRKIVSEQYNKTHHGYSSYLHILDVKKMDIFYENVNLLTYSYTRFHKMPDQIKVMTESEMKNRIANVLDLDKKDIELEKESPINAMYVYRFEIGNGYGGEIDAITGQITHYFGDTGPLSDGPIMDKKEAEKKAMSYLEKIYGKDINLEIVSLGFNFNSFADDSRYKVYSFKAVPKVEGFTLYTPLETETILNLNAKNGKLESFDHNRHVPSFDELNAVDQTASSGNIDDKKAVIIYSALSGKFELVFMIPDLEYFQEGKFISVKTGLEEKIYIDAF
jgi:hypothetical protein